MFREPPIRIKKELELTWEGIRDLSSIAQALADHNSLIGLNLAHNEVSLGHWCLPLTRSLSELCVVVGLATCDVPAVQLSGLQMFEVLREVG